MPDPSDSTAPMTKAPEGSSPGQAPEPATGKPGNPAPTAEPLSLVPRSRSAAASAKDAAAAGAAGAPASVTDLMQWMKMFAAATEAPPAEPTKPGARLQRSTLPKDQRKFQRFDREPDAPEPPAEVAPPAVGDAPENRGADDRFVSPATTSAPPEAGKASPPSSPPVPIALTGGTSGRRVRTAVARQPRLWLVLEAGVLVLLVGAFLLGRASVSKTAAPALNNAPGAPNLDADGMPVATLSPDAAKAIDEAMAAEQDRDFDKATDLLLKVRKDFPQVRDVDFRLASLALERNDPFKAMPLLNQAIIKNEQPAAAYRLRGTIVNRRGGVTRGMNDFESATTLDPFSAESFFFWGEALRRAGKTQAALVKLQEAIDRLREPELEAEYRLKIRLAMIELGRENEFAPEMAARLAEDPPPPDWLLTAAAVALQHRDLAQASNFLEKASHLMDKDLFAMRLRDYYFFGYRLEKPLAKFFAFATASRPPAATAASPAPSPVGAP